MKKMYEKPMAFEEAFVADEYVAACYFLACERGSNGWTGNADKWGGVREYGYGVSHSPLGTSHTCGDKTANRVITDNGGVFEKVQEHNGQQGWISGTYCGYDDNDHNNIVEIKIEDGITMEPLSKRMLITQIIHNLRILIEAMIFTYIIC
jgi:hypothetical protein